MRAKLFYVALAIDFENVAEVLDETVLFIQNIKCHRGVYFENYSKNCGKIHRSLLLISLIKPTTLLKTGSNIGVLL